MQAYIFLVLAQCQKQHSECVAVSIKEYRTFGRDQCREHLSYRCFLVVTFQDCSFVRGGGESLPYIWKFFHQDSHLHLDGGRVLQENDVSKVTDDAVQPGGARFLRQRRGDNSFTGNSGLQDKSSTLNVSKTTKVAYKCKHAT